VPQRLHNIIHRLVRCGCLVVGIPILLLAITQCANSETNNKFVEYRRTGGILRADDHIVIYDDYRTVLTRATGNSEFVLDTTTGDHLREILEAANFPQYENRYAPADDCCDLLTYRISYGGKTIEALDTAVPAALQPIIDDLNSIIDSH
jgi:hypothetical protein